jgi:hypothetical protein
MLHSVFGDDGWVLVALTSLWALQGQSPDGEAGRCSVVEIRAAKHFGSWALTGLVIQTSADLGPFVSGP